jgi:hypothetical protein
MANVFDNLNTNTPEGRKKQRDSLLSGNPQDAMRNALLDSGFNPYFANPFVKRLLGAANGMSFANAAQNVGRSPDDIAAAGGEGAILADTLRNNISNGSVFSTLASTASGMPGLTGKLTDLRNQMAAGGMNAADANPFLQMLGESMNSAEGVQGALSSLYGPLLGPGLGRAYQTQMGGILGGQERNQANDPDTYTPGKDRAFWEYVFQNVAPGSAQAREIPGANPLNPAGAPTPGEAGGSPLQNGPILGSGAPDGPVNGPPAPTSGIGAPAPAGGMMERVQGTGVAPQMGNEVVQGSGIAPEQLQAVAAQAGISEDSLLKILRDMAVEGGNAAGLPMQAFNGMSTANIMPNIKSLNPYLSRLLSLAGA